MINPGSPIADSDYGEGLIHKMTTIRNTFSSGDPEGKDIVVAGRRRRRHGRLLHRGWRAQLQSPPDFEAPREAAASDTLDNTYTVTVQASDGGHSRRPLRMVERAVTVEVTNVEEPGSVMLSTLQPQVRDRSRRP